MRCRNRSLKLVGSPSLFLAFAAGFVSFVSPCCLPLVPGYLATVSGVRSDAAPRARLDPRVLARSGLFGLDKPALMFKAAEFFQKEAELSRLLRRTELDTSSPNAQPHLFLNTHPTELAHCEPKRQVGITGQGRKKQV